VIDLGSLSLSLAISLANRNN